MSRFLRACEGPCSIALVALFIAIVFGLSIASRSVLLGDLDRVAATRAAQAGLSAAVAARLDARTARDPAVRAVLARAAALRVQQSASDVAARRNIDRILAVELVLGTVGVALMFAAVRLRRTVHRQDMQIATMRRVRELRSIADLFDDLLWTAGPDGRVDYVSQRWLARSGLAGSDALAGGWERAVHPDDVALTARDWRKAVENGEGFDVEHRIREASGGYRWFRSRAIALRDQRGAVAGWFGISTDVDAPRRRLETQERASAGERRLFEHLRAALAAPPLPEVPFIAFDAARVGGESEGDGISAQWYEAVLLPDDRIFVCLGRGVGESGTEALDAIDLARRAIRGAAAEETCPRTVLARANTVVLLRRGSAIAALCGYFDAARQRFTYASAGHDAPLLVGSTGTRVLGAGGLPLGVLVGAEFALHEVSIANALLVLVGITAHGETPAGTGSDAALLDAVGQAAAAASPAAAIAEALRARANGAEAVVVTARGVASGAGAAREST